MIRHTSDIWGNPVSQDGKGHKLVHTTDIWGNRVSYSSDGTKYAHTVDMWGNKVTYGSDGNRYTHTVDAFGNQVSYGSDGSRYIHTTDIFGNSVTYDSHGNSIGSTSESDSAAGGLAAGLGALIIAPLAFFFVFCGIAMFLFHAGRDFYMTVGICTLVYFMFTRTYGHLKVRSVIPFYLALELVNVSWQSVHLDPAGGAFGYIGYAMIWCLVFYAYVASSESPYAMPLFFALAIMFFYLLGHHNSTAEKAIYLVSAGAFLYLLVYDLITNFRLKFFISMFCNTAMVFSGVITMHLIEHILFSPAVFIFLLSAFIIIFPMLINRLAALVGLAIPCSPYGHLLGVVIMSLLLPGYLPGEYFTMIVSMILNKLVPLSGSLAVLVYLAVLYVISCLIYPAVNRHILRGLVKATDRVK